MSEILRLLGQLAKAYTDEAGQPVLEVLASGPELDRQGERLSKAAREKFAALAKAGTLPLVPSHDVPLSIATSIDGAVTEDGHLVVKYGVERDDPLAMRLHKAVAEGTWKGQVSVGSPSCTRADVFDQALGKTVREVADFDETGAHIATTFPGRAAYPHAAVSALFKAVGKEHDVAELAARGWPEDVLAKAVEAGVWVPPTFGDRLAQRKLQDELPELLEVFRYTVEDLVSPWSLTDNPEERRARLRQSFGEFENAVFGELAAATEPMTKSITEGAPATALTIVSEPSIEERIGAAVAAAVAPLAKALGEAQGTIEALSKSMAERAAVPANTPEPPQPGRTTTVLAHTGRQVEDGGTTPDRSALRKAIDDEVEELKKQLDVERDPGRRTRIAERLNLLHLRQATL